MRRELIVVAAALLAPAAAQAGGLGRPTVISARAFGWGGAFTAVADDASALHYNPAGLALQDKSSLLLGGEVVIAPRTYTPEFADPMTCQPPAPGDPPPPICRVQSPANRPNLVPTLGYVNRPRSRGVPSRVALGIGVWNTFGGELHYEHVEGLSALDMVRDAVIEVVPGVAYEVNDFLAIGAAFRLGIGLFAVEASDRPADGSFSGIGVGAGATVGIMIRPSQRLNIGLVYRTALTVSTKGDGELDTDVNPATPPEPVDVSHDQTWPQSAAISLAYRVTPKLRLAAQLDWTDWSRINRIVIHFPSEPSLDPLANYEEDWNDTFAVHAGGELAVSRRLDLRAGYTYDSQAVPDRTIERTYLDAPKHAVAVGAGIRISRRWRVDTAFELIFGPAREIADNRQEYQDAGWPDRANVAPGRHEGKVYTFDLQAQFQY